MANYKLSNAANADLDAILTYGILNHGERRADTYYEGLVQQFESLVRNPHLYPERTEISPPVRVCPFGVHVIIYTLEDTGTVLIIRVRHGHEDWL